MKNDRNRSSHVEPLVSVVIPCRDRPVQLARAIGSALMQSDVAIDVIVVDDGSIEDIRRVVKAFNDPRLRYVRFDENRGAAAARNLGVDMAESRYVAFLDSDDWWSPDKISRQLTLATSAQCSKRPWLIYNAVNIVGLSGAGTAPRRPFDEAADTLADYLIVERNYMQTSGLFGPAALFRRFRFDPESMRHQDVDLLLRMHAAGVELRYCRAPTVFYDDTENAGRTGKITTVGPTLEWMQRHGDLLTDRARAEMYITYVGLNLLKRFDPRGAWYVLKGAWLDPSCLTRVLERKRQGWFKHQAASA